MSINSEETALLGQICGCDSDSRWAGPTPSPCGLSVTWIHRLPTDWRDGNLAANGSISLLALGLMHMDPGPTASDTKRQNAKMPLSAGGHGRPPWNSRFLFLASNQIGFQTRKKEECLHYADFPPPPEFKKQNHNNKKKISNLIKPGFCPNQAVHSF